MKTAQADVTVRQKRMPPCRLARAAHDLWPISPDLPKIQVFLTDNRV